MRGEYRFSKGKREWRRKKERFLKDEWVLLNFKEDPISAKVSQLAKLRARNWEKAVRNIAYAQRKQKRAYYLKLESVY